MKYAVGDKLTNKSLNCNAGWNAHKISKTERVNREKALLDFILYNKIKKVTMKIFMTLTKEKW